jgi:hypothetical protein
MSAMAGHPFRTVLMRLWLALLLATIGLQATPPGKLDLFRDHGSAFSASTYDLAIASQPERLVQSPLVAPRPRPELQLTLSDSRQDIAARLAWSELGARGPPRPAVSVLPYPPRAPPSA